MQTTQRTQKKNQVKCLHILSFSGIVYTIFIETIADVDYLI